MPMFSRHTTAWFCRLLAGRKLVDTGLKFPVFFGSHRADSEVRLEKLLTVFNLEHPRVPQRDGFSQGVERLFPLDDEADFWEVSPIL